MTPEQFVYWLQGFFELRAADPEMASKPITPAQEKMIRDHLALVFMKVTPAVPGVPAPMPFIPDPLPGIGPFVPQPHTPGLPWWHDQIICTGTKLGTSVTLCAQEAP